MACEIKFQGKIYTKDEFDALPPEVKLEEALSSPDFEAYMLAGVKGLNKDTILELTTIPGDPVQEAQEEYESAKTEIERVVEHAENVRAKIKEIFGRHMSDEQVEYSLILLDTMAEAWSEKTGALSGIKTPKEYYYQRYQDVQDSDYVDGKIVPKSTAENKSYTDPEDISEDDVEIMNTPADEVMDTSSEEATPVQTEEIVEEITVPEVAVDESNTLEETTEENTTTEETVEETVVPIEEVVETPAPVTLDPSEYKNGVKSVKSTAQSYRADNKIRKTPHKFVSKLREFFSVEMAKVYAKKSASSRSKDVKRAYDALAVETIAQYKYIVEKGGLKVSRWLGEGEPYANSTEMLKDLAENNHLWFLPNSTGFGDGEVKVDGRLGLSPTDVTLDDGYKMTLSEVFRVVHDYFGHGLLGNQFGPTGEENATLQHLDLYSDVAAPAVIFQTRGQNSWVNFSKANVEAKRLFAEAKRLDKEGNTVEAESLRKQAQEMFKFAEPKDNIFPNIYNFRKYDTVRRIEEQRKSAKDKLYINPVTGDRTLKLPSILTKLTEKRSGKYGDVTRTSVEGVRQLGEFSISVKNEYILGQKLDASIKAVFPKFKGVQKIYEVTDGAVFREMMIAHSSDNPHKACVTLHSAEAFNEMRMFVTEDGSTGITLTKEGFLGGGFSSGTAGRPNNLSQLVILGIKEGAITAEAFDTVLPDYYAQFGFKAVSRVAFNDEYRPSVENGAMADWDYDTYKSFNNGRPDVVFMIYDGGVRETIEERIGDFEGYKNYQKAETQAFDKDGYEGATQYMQIEALNKSLVDGYERVMYERDEGLSEQGLLFEARQSGLDGVVERAAVEALDGNKFVLHALTSPDAGSLVHEFMHVAEQDLDDYDIEVMESWSGHTRGTEEFKEAVADGFVKFISEGHPELNEINTIFTKLAKLISKLYKKIVSSPLDLKLNDQTRMVYAKIMGVEEAFSRRLNASLKDVEDLTDRQRKELLSKKGVTYKKYAPSQLPAGTKVVKKDGKIGIVGMEDLSGTTAKDRREGIFELAVYPLLIDVAKQYKPADTAVTSTKSKKKVTPACV